MKRPDTLANELERLLGRASREALIGASGLDDDPLLTLWVTRIGEAVAAHSDRLDTRPEFLILGSDVANAITLPGSTVLVTRGLLDELTSDDELAGVLAHETGHVAKRHAWHQIESNAIFALALNLARPKSNVLQQGLPLLNLLRALAQSREGELEADTWGLRFAAAAGYAPQGLLRFVENMASGPMARWEEYFATHPPGTRRAQLGKAQPVVGAADPDSREALAAGFEARGFVGLGGRARRGEDPLALPPATPMGRQSALPQERRILTEQVQALQKRLQASYKPLLTGSTLQQLLLLTAPTQDVRFLALSTHAYLVQFQIQDAYARTVRSLRLAGAVWSDLLPSENGDLPEWEQGRIEVNTAVRALDAVPTPLQRASQAALTALADLQLGRFYRLGSSGAQWTRLAVVEGLVRYAESELSRADRAAALAWRYLALARIRRYQRRLDLLCPVGPGASMERTLWRDLMTRRIGLPPETERSAGEESLLALLQVQRGKPIAPPIGRVSADWVAQNGGIPENMATVLRLVTLDLERELAARKQKT